MLEYLVLRESRLLFKIKWLVTRRSQRHLPLGGKPPVSLTDKTSLSCIPQHKIHNHISILTSFVKFTIFVNFAASANMLQQMRNQKSAYWSHCLVKETHCVVIEDIINFGHKRNSLNFIRLLGVVITQRRKRLEAIGWISDYKRNRQKGWRFLLRDSGLRKW